MMNKSYDFGMIGLGTMGRNFLLNVADRGFAAAGLDLDAAKVAALDEESGGRLVRGTTYMAEFIGWLALPRRIMLLVPAGKAVDAVIADLLPHLDAGDLIIDGGNSHYEDTERRARQLSEQGMRFLGVGVSGGAEGARRGPSIMPGGDRAAYELIRPVFEAAAAAVDGDPCVAYMGLRSAGHYVKMVHNGIEYGLMQLIAEAYDLMRRGLHISNEEIHQAFARWNGGRLRSFLLGITADIFARRDPQSGDFLVDRILDKAKQKGTGKWTSQSALDLGIPIPTIDAAVSMRGISSFKREREQAGRLLPPPRSGGDAPDRDTFLRNLEGALHFAFVITYAQGLHLLAAASREYDYGLNLSEIAKIWRGGCIIRADLLEPIRQAYATAPETTNLLFADYFQEELIRDLPAAVTIVNSGTSQGIPLLAFSSALHYARAFYSGRLPLNLVQAQRDYFGAHTYERTDMTGTFHTDW